MKRDALPLIPDPVLAPDPVAIGWRYSLPALAVALLVEIAAFWNTASSMAVIWWKSETFAHGFTVVPIAAWLIWRKRATLRTLVPRPAPVVLPVMAIMGLGWLAGEFGSVNALSQLAFVGMLILTVVAILGLGIARAIFFPLGFLLFAVPIGDFLLQQLMGWTADFTVAALRATGIPVYREGLLLVVPNGRWSVIEACSGVRYLIASLMVGTLFAYLTYNASWRRWVFVAFSAVVPIVANWVRAYLIVLLGYLSDNRLAVGVDHIIYGWLFFGFVMLLMFGIGSRWREPPEDEELGKAHGAAGVPLVRLGAARLSRFAGVAATASLIALVWPIADAATDIPPREFLPPIRIAAIPDWQAAKGDLLGVRPAAPVWSESIFERDGRKVGLGIAYYQAQDVRRKLSRVTGTLFGTEGNHWVRTVVGTRRASIGHVERTVAETHVLSPGGRRLLVWEWYWIDGTVTASNAIAKASIGWSRLIHGSDDSAAILLFTDDTPDGRAASALARFARDAWPAIAEGLKREAAR